MSESTSGLPPAQPCGICSNGPVQIYHYGCPCPYTYTAGRIEALPGAIGIDTGEIHRAPLIREIAERDTEIERLRGALETLIGWCETYMAYHSKKYEESGLVAPTGLHPAIKEARAALHSEGGGDA